MLKRLSPWAVIAFFLVLYHSNFREQGVPGDTFKLKLLNFSLLKGYGLGATQLWFDLAWGNAHGEGFLPGWWRPGMFAGVLDRPIFTALPFLPLYALYYWLGGAVSFFSVNFLAKVSDVFCALATLLAFYRIAENFKLPRERAHFLVFAFGISTHIWHSVSQAMLTSTGFVPFYAWALAALSSPKLGQRHLLAASTCLAYAVACRQQDFPLVLPFFAWMLWHHRRNAILVLTPPLVIGALAAWLNRIQNGSALLGTYAPEAYANSQSTQMTGRAYGLTASLFDGLPGILFSPGRGLFVYAPIFLFGVWWATQALRDELETKKSRRSFSLLKTAVLAVILEVLMLSKFSVWWGGYSWGPRLLTSAIPALFLLMAMTFPKRGLSTALSAGVAAAIAWGAFTQALAAYKYRFTDWNGYPVSIDAAPQRVWDKQDSPIARIYAQPWPKLDWEMYSIEGDR